jgi:hypothetical protein
VVRESRELRTEAISANQTPTAVQILNARQHLKLGTRAGHAKLLALHCGQTVTRRAAGQAQQTLSLSFSLHHLEGSSAKVLRNRQVSPSNSKA